MCAGAHWRFGSYRTVRGAGRGGAGAAGRLTGEQMGGVRSLHMGSVAGGHRVGGLGAAGASEFVIGRQQRWHWNVLGFDCAGLFNQIRGHSR
jgi:hypothetical protein